MSKVILAEYDAEHQSLKLPEPLAGIMDHEKVRVAIEERPTEAAERPWMRLEGCLPPETADEIRRALEAAASPDER